MPLSRILGGIHLENVRVSRIRKEGLVRADSGDNSKLIMMGSCVLAFFVICYCVGAYRIIT